MQLNLGTRQQQGSVRTIDNALGAIAVVLSLAIIGGGIYLRSYIGKKAEHLATREDVDILTSKVESVKSSFRLQEEAVKAALAKDVTAHESRFQMELPIYREIWEKYLTLDVALTHVRISARAGVTTDGRDHRLAYANFRTELEALQALIKRHEPFFAPEVQRALTTATLPLRVIAATATGAPSPEEQEAILNRESKEVVNSMHSVSTSIRDRLYADAAAVASLLPTEAKH
ncbi:MAG: hypothetical protein JWL61_2123 [Gemmatimonadetes bacterium]|nr:hypothetical protein [Gemmatimonadota bacterium]